MRTMNILREEKGVALLMVLLIATIILSVTTTMLYLLTQSTRYSGLGKRFASASEAAMAASEVYTGYIGLADTAAYRQKLHDTIGFMPATSSACESTKLEKDTVDWASCNNTILIDPADPNTYDSYFDLGNYRVFAKIVYTFKGNTAPPTSSSTGGAGAPEWIRTCVIHCQGEGSKSGYAGAESQFTTPSPYTYLIEVDARRMSGGTLIPEESAKLSIVYQY